MKYGLCEGVSIEYVDGHSVLITENGDAAVLNEVAAFIVDALVGAEEIDSIVSGITDRYSVDGAVAREDIDSLIKELEEKYLMESSDDTV